MRADYEFGHTLDAKVLPRGDSSATGPLVRLFKPFDELFVDFEVYIPYHMLLYFSLLRSRNNTYVICCSLNSKVYSLQEFDVDALVKFVQETSTPTVTLFNKDPKHHPFVVKYFNSPNVKVHYYLLVLSLNHDIFCAVIMQQKRRKNCTLLLLIESFLIHVNRCSANDTLVPGTHARSWEILNLI